MRVRVLCEAAWAYDQVPKISRHLLKRQENLSPAIVAVTWKAQTRLCARFRRLSATRIHRNKVNTAIARELSGFIWHIARLAMHGAQIPSPQVYPLRNNAKSRATRPRVVAPAA